MEACQWEAIVDEATFYTVSRILSAPERKTMRDNRVRHLLSQLAMCDRCLEGGTPDAKSLLNASVIKGKWRYRCPAPQGHVLIVEDMLDAFVEAAVFEWLCSPAAMTVFRPNQSTTEVDRLRDRIAGMKGQLEEMRELATSFDENGTPRLSAASLAAAEQRLEPLITGCQLEFERLTAAADPLLGKLVGSSLDLVSRVWNHELTLPQKRHLLRSVVNVSVVPTGRKYPLLPLSERVQLRFAGEPGFRAHRRSQRVH